MRRSTGSSSPAASTTSPPPLLQQLTPDGMMVIPVGPPCAQHVIKAVRRTGPDGIVSVVRSDIYGGAIIPFVPFTGGHQS